MAEQKQNLEYILETMNLEAPTAPVDLASYRDADSLFDHKANERIGAALRLD